MEETDASPHSRGPEILSNPVIIESIIPALEHMNDILSLSLVSRHTYLLVNPLHPLSARKLSLAGQKHVRNRDVTALLYRPLGSVMANSRRRLLEDGRTVTISGGLEKGYVGAWRYLTSINLSNTLVSTRFVKLLIAASAGGKVPGLVGGVPAHALSTPAPDTNAEIYGPADGLFSKEFGFMSLGAYRLLNDQSLRLERLCVTDCPLVDIMEVITFLKKLLIAATGPRRNELRSRAAQHLTAAQQGGAANPNNHPVLGANPQPAPQAQQQQAQAQQAEDLSAVPSPLPSTVEELAEFGLPCLSLKRLEIANVKGLYVDPPEKYRGKAEWSYAKECPFGRSVGGLNSVAGCLGIDVDVLFCQGAGCATSFDHSRWRLSEGDIEDSHTVYDNDFDANQTTSTQPDNSFQAPGSANPALVLGGASHQNGSPRNPRKTYDFPLPRLPGERILIMDNGRVFRIPRHAIPTPHTPLQQQPHHQILNTQLHFNPPAAPTQAQAQAQANAIPNWASSTFLQDPAQYGLGTVGGGVPNTTSLATTGSPGSFGNGAGWVVNTPASQLIPPPFHSASYFHLPNPLNPGSGPSTTSTQPPSLHHLTMPQNLSEFMASISGTQTPPPAAVLSYLASGLPPLPPALGSPSSSPSPSGGAGAVTGGAPGTPSASSLGGSPSAAQQQGGPQPTLGPPLHGPPPMMQQTHNQNQPAPGIGLSLGPRRRNNSPGGRTGSGATVGRPGRRIAMLDGPRGLCEGCGREVWLCESCNRYWVVTCGGCASRG